MDSIEVMELVHNTLANLRDGYTLSWNGLDANEKELALKLIAHLAEELAESEAKAERAMEEALLQANMDQLFKPAYLRGVA